MVGSISNNNTPSLVVSLMKEAAAKQNLEVTMVKKAQDLQKMQGEAALKLIDAANVVEPGKIDVRV